MTVVARTVRFDDLPDDMQDLVAGLVWPVLGEDGVPADLPVVDVPLDDLPDVPLADPEADGDDRGVDHALAMDPDDVPPIIVADGLFLDGRHRVWRFRSLGRGTIPAIDLTGIADPGMRDGMAMGTVGPQPAPPAPGR